MFFIWIGKANKLLTDPTISQQFSLLLSGPGAARAAGPWEYRPAAHASGRGPPAHAQILVTLSSPSPSVSLTQLTQRKLNHHLSTSRPPAPSYINKQRIISVLRLLTFVLCLQIKIDQRHLFSYL